MTERTRGEVRRDADTLQLGPSHVHWTGEALEIVIEERDKRLGVPWQRRVVGRVRVIPEALNSRAFALDPAGRHRWHCIAPRARIEVVMERPELRWKGDAYLDSNFGSESLEEGFRVWHWSRAHVRTDGGRGGAVVSYEGIRRDGGGFASALRFGHDGTPHEEELPPVAPLRGTKWLMERKTRADRGLARVQRTWEDAPFYARSTLAANLFGEPVVAVQESLDLDRFASPIVQFMLPYRIPRSAG
ncbi:hydroxyneurosporene dehydrogenase [Novosphingobium piscinae]|uniref:Hydroxyneurosporene dehydrogenase n=1 Tax=Novosphingobium piscinae TaxID=1507448 RepID=A0A7X1KP89_9SPHN|nr:hydroxyneurosporene dehydrogenase [Novosphingobium piscinae]MBC2668501.1 hydroxyneurosporene dehydrogenase [Novosphingobium piscinae]